MQSKTRVSGVDIASYVLAFAALLMIMERGLLAALFSGLLVNALVHLMAPALGRHANSRRAKMLAAGLLGGIIVLALTAAIWGSVSFFSSEAGSVPVLLKKMADIIEASRQQIPEWLRLMLPAGAEDLREKLTELMRTHAATARLVGEQAGRTALHIFVGMVIGAMAATYDTSRMPDNGAPLAAALRERIGRISQVFEQIVFAQVRIAALNTLFTAVFLLVALPLFGVHLPLTKTVIALTFVVGLLPVIGNLISNTVIVVIGLSISVNVALAALIFLISIHKIEYFLNAKIIGSHIDAHAWELLAAMLFMESLFGIPGVVAAPVFYAYMKRELAARELL